MFLVYSVCRAGWHGAKKLCHISTGNGYIEGTELEGFFHELEVARRGAAVVSGSP